MKTVSQAEKKHTTHTHMKYNNEIHTAIKIFVRHNYMIDVINYFGVLFRRKKKNIIITKLMCI